MARPKSTVGMFRLKDGVRPYAVDGDVVERFTDHREAQKRLAEQRAAATASGANPYNIILLPLGPNGEGLFGPGQ